MGWNDHVEDDSFSDFLREIVANLDDPAKGITLQVIDKGIESLSKKQNHVFMKFVTDVYVTNECSRQGCTIPWSEMYEAYSNGGMCSWCAHMDYKNRKD